MVALLYLGGCGLCGTAAAYLRARGLPFLVVAARAVAPAEER